MRVAQLVPIVGVPSSASDGWDANLEKLLSPVPLQQTNAWGDVSRSLGWRVTRLGLSGGNAALVLTRGHGPLRWGYVPRGPVPPTIEAVEELIVWARSQGLAMLRVEPEAGPELGVRLRTGGFRRGQLSEPSRTLIVTLGADEHLLGSFHSGTRHKVRKAERLGVVVEESGDIEELERQVSATYRRQRVFMDTSLVRAFHQAIPTSRIYVALHNSVPLAAILIARHGSRAYYLAGGSNGLHRELLPNHALQWRAMRDAYRDGCVDYDLHGIPPSRQPNHPWHGLYQFKTGFGGREVEYAGPWDIALTPWADALNRIANAVATRSIRAVHRVGAAIGRSRDEGA